MVKRSRVLAELEAEADLPYERTRLAQQAVRARRRLALLLLAGAAVSTVEAALARSGWLALATVAIALAAWGVRKDRLGGVVAAALLALLGALVPLALMFVGGRGVGERVVMAFVVVWGLVMLPDVVTLVRDAELQHSYGRWARRD